MIPRVPYVPKEDRTPVQWSERTTLREDVLEKTAPGYLWPRDPRIGVPNQRARRAHLVPDVAAPSASASSAP